MTTKNHTTTTLALAALAGLALAAGPAQAATIYSETFSGSGDLNGTAPDVTTGGNTWTASAAWNKDGSVDAGTDADNAFLAFSPTAGKVYTLSATLTQPSGPSWAAIGFTQSNATGIDFWSGANLASPWVLYRSSSNVDSFLGTGVNGTADEGDHAGPLTLSIVLDTTGAQWTAEWFVGGSSARTETFGSNPTSITHVGLGRESNTNTTFSDFSLTVASGAGSFQLTIAPIAATPGNYDFEWASLDSKVYDLVSSTDLSTPRTSWPVWDGKAGIEGTAPTNTLVNVAGSADPERYFAVLEKDPPPLIEEDFESGNGGFTMVDHSAEGTGSDWVHGDPNSSGDGGSVTTGNGESTNCWGTDLNSIYATGTDTSLISPVIDLTGAPNAVLSFAQAIDIFTGDTLVVNVLDDTTDTVLQAAVHTSTPDPDITSADWETVSSVAITGGEPVRLEWRFTGTNDGTYLGAYIDDVVVTETTP